MNRHRLVFVIPLAALVFVGVVMLSLGAIFSALGNLGTDVEGLGAIIVGLLLMFLVPAVAVLVLRRTGGGQKGP